MSARRRTFMKKARRAIPTPMPREEVPSAAPRGRGHEVRKMGI